MPLSAPRPASRRRSRCGSFARDGVGRSYAALGANCVGRSQAITRAKQACPQASEASVPSSERSKRAKQACPHASEASVPSSERSKRALTRAKQACPAHKAPTHKNNALCVVEMGSAARSRRPSDAGVHRYAEERGRKATPQMAPYRPRKVGWGEYPTPQPVCSPFARPDGV